MEDGFLLMGLGMISVFAFLVILMILVKVVAVLVRPIAHLLEEPATVVARPAAKPAQSGDKTLMAAAVAAVHMHRNKKK